MRNLLKSSLILVLFLIVVWYPRAVSAQELIHNFEVNITAHQNGQMTVTEKIQYDFGQEERHGIYRMIPLVSPVGDLYRIIDVGFTDISRDGQTEPYEIDKSAEQTEVKIGDADTTMSGVHTYTITYEVSNGIGSNYADHDEIYWNVTGDKWRAPIEAATVTIQTDFGANPGETTCFTGTFGEKGTNCLVTSAVNTKKVSIAQPLMVGSGLTVVTAFPVNTFPKSTLQKDKPFVDPDLFTFLKIITPIYAGINFLVAPAILLWYFQNKRRARFGAPAVNFDLPEYPKKVRITPAEAGTIDNAKLDKDDVVATIFDLAIRKYLKIEQVKVKGKFLGLGTTTDYTLTKLKEFTDLNDFENTLVKALFSGGDTASLKESKLTYTDFESLETENFKSLVSRGFYTKNPKVQMEGLHSTGIFATILFNLILGPVLIFLSNKLNGRTAVGDEVDWKIEGLKIFLKNMTRYYKFQADKDYFVEKMIPYAMALGYIDEYMAQLKVLDPAYKPTWYSGSGDFYHFYPAFYSSMNSNITTTAPASSSGFSGGSSGGGGGGGGGGSW